MMAAKAERLRKMKSAESNNRKPLGRINEVGILEEILKPEKTERIILN